ncbi:MAG: PA14 domain-containing protein, partial [Acidimicrobiales bacterium]
MSPPSAAVVADDTPYLVAGAAGDPDGDPVSYWFRIATGTDANSGTIVESGWLANPAWAIGPIDSSHLQDGVTYFWNVFVSDGCQTVSPGWVANLRVDLRQGYQPGGPTDQVGPASVSLADGNLSVGWQSPTVASLAGPLGVTLAYNSRADTGALFGGGLMGEYFADTNANRLFDDGPARMVRRDPQVSFNWGTDSPLAGALPTDDFLVRWTGTLNISWPASWSRIGAASDDGVRVWVNDALVLDRWFDQWTPTPQYGPYFQSFLPVPIRIEYYEKGGGSHLQLWIRADASPWSPALERPLPAAWLHNTAAPDGAIPGGWTLAAPGAGSPFVSLRPSEHSVTLTDLGGRAHTFPRLPGGGWGQAPGEGTVLTQDHLGRFSAHADDGVTYVFDEHGHMTHAAGMAEQGGPLTPGTTFGTVNGARRLTNVFDPASGRGLVLSYGGDAACAVPPPAGFLAAPPGRLCRVAYPAGDPTRIWYIDGPGEHIGRIADPGGAATDFNWAGYCKLHRVRTPLMNDAVAAGVVPNDAAHWAQFDYGAGFADGRVASVTLPPPVGGALRPQHSYTSSANQATVSVAGIAGTHRSVTFDEHGRLLSDTDATGRATTYQWDGATLHEQPPPGRPPVGPARLRSVTGPAGLRTTTLYEEGSGHLFPDPMATDSYGPAPAPWFATNGRPLTNDAEVPHTLGLFDGGMAGLRATYWGASTTMSGPPTAMGLGVGGPGGALDRDWGTGSPAAGIGVDTWSAIFTGTVTLPLTGTYRFRALSDDGVRIFVDGRLISQHWSDHAPEYSPYGEVANTVAGARHQIRVEYYENGGGAMLRLLWGPPGPGPEEVVPGAYLAPRFGLPTTTYDFDTNTGAASTATTTTAYASPARGLPTSVTVNAGADALVSTTAYEAAGPGAFSRRTARASPAGPATTYAYYGVTEARANPCPAGGSASQAGLLRTATGPD